MGWLIYGKRTKPYISKSGNLFEIDKKFAPLDWKGFRVTKKSDAFEYATKEDAQDRLDKIKSVDGAVFEVRKS